MSKEDIIQTAIDKFHTECAKIPNDKTLTEKLPMHEDLLIKTILETLLEK